MKNKSKEKVNVNEENNKKENKNSKNNILNKIINSTKDFRDFFLQNILKKSLIVGIIIAVLTLALVSTYFTDSNSSSSNNRDENTTQNEQLDDSKEVGPVKIINRSDTVNYVAETLLKLLIIIFAGFVPYIYIGAIGILSCAANITSIILALIFYPTFSNRNCTWQWRHNNINIFNSN